MSLTSLPPEILTIIAKYTSDSYWHEKVLTHQNRQPDPDLEYRISCDNDGIVPLASVNTTMRHVCLPVLFSKIHVIRVQVSWTVVLEALERMLRSRRDIGESIRYLNLYERNSQSVGLTIRELSILSSVIELLPGIRSLSYLQNPLSAEFIASVNSHASLCVVNIAGIPEDIPDSSVNALRRFTKEEMFLWNSESEYSTLQTALRHGLGLQALTINPKEHQITRASKLNLSSLVELTIAAITCNSPGSNFEERLHALVARCPMLTRIWFLEVTPFHRSISGSSPKACPPAVYSQMPLLRDTASAFWMSTDPEDQSSYPCLITHYAISRIDSKPGHKISNVLESLWSLWTITEADIGCYTSLDLQNFRTRVKAVMPLVEKLTLKNRLRDRKFFCRHAVLSIDPTKVAPLLAGLGALNELGLWGFAIEGEDPPENPELFADSYTPRVRVLADTLKANVPSLERITGSGRHGETQFIYTCRFRNRPISEGGGFETVVTIKS